MKVNQERLSANAMILMGKKNSSSIRIIKIKYWLCSRILPWICLFFLTGYCARFPDINFPNEKAIVAPNPVFISSAGYLHSCMVKARRVFCWGNAAQGRLGYGNVDDIGDDETPASAGFVDVGGEVKQVSAGDAHTCALLTNGSVRCWGYGAEGRLGYGNVDIIGDGETPASAGNVDVGDKVKQISAGYAHTCALLTNGNVRCWGYGANGRLGYGNTSDIGDNETPESAGDVNIGSLQAEYVSVGNSHSCALLTNGNVRCWGSGAEGRLGYGNVDDIGDNETPASAGNVDVGDKVKQIRTGSDHSCALLTNGNVRCWGSGAEGRLGYSNVGNIGDTETPESAGDVNIGSLQAEYVSVGNDHSCALLTNGNVRCWGSGAEGRLGYGNVDNIGDTETPESAGNVNIGSQQAEYVFVGTGYSCALLTDNNVRCWGNGAGGRLGYGNTNDIGDDETPASAGNLILP